MKMTNQERKAYLESVKKAQLSENPHGSIHRCPRCGADMKKDILHNALSRHADVYICDACGTDEAVRDWGKNVLPLFDWFVIRNLETYGEFPKTVNLLAIDPIVEDNCVEVTFECYFDQEGKFGVDLSDDDTWLNLYASYNVDTEELNVSYVVSDNKDNNQYVYVPTEAERITVIEAMTRSCKAHNFGSMADMVAHYAIDEGEVADDA